MDISEFIDFRIFITTNIMKWIYGIGFMTITLAGFACSLSGIFGFKFGFPSDGQNIIYGIALLTFGNVIWRLICEGAILMFKIRDLLAEVRNELTNKKG